MRRFLLLLMPILLWPAIAVAGLPSAFHDFAQIVEGGDFRTIILVMNQNSVTVTITIKFYGDDGTPLALTINGTTNAEHTFPISGGGTIKLTTAGPSAPQLAGWGQLTADGKVGAQVLFEIYTGTTLLSQAAVESVGPVDNVDLFVDETTTSNTGFAIANLSDSSSILVRITFTDENNNEIGTKDIVLVKLGHTATFVFQNIDEDTTGKRGRLRIQTSGPVAVVALQLTQTGTGGSILGTLPVVLFI